MRRACVNNQNYLLALVGFALVQTVHYFLPTFYLSQQLPPRALDHGPKPPIWIVTDYILRNLLNPNRNGEADKLAHSRTALDLLEPEPVVGFPLQNVNKNANDSICQEHKLRWSEDSELRQQWALISGPDHWRGRWMTAGGRCRSRPNTTMWV